MVIGIGLAAAAGMGAVGGLVANIALTPLTAGAGLLQSYWYGSGLILGERMMYTVHWEKIKARLDKGENFMDILDQEMNDDITAVAELSFKAMDKTAEIFHSQATISLGKFIEDLISAALNPFFSGDRDSNEETDPEPDPDTGLISLSFNEVNLLSDTTLAHYTQNILQNFDVETQNLLTQEQQRRNRIETDPEPTLTPEATYATQDEGFKDFLVKHSPWLSTPYQYYPNIPLALRKDLDAFSKQTTAYQNYLIDVNAHFAQTKQLWQATDPNNTQYAIRQAIHEDVQDLIIDVSKWLGLTPP